VAGVAPANDPVRVVNNLGKAPWAGFVAAKPAGSGVNTKTAGAPPAPSVGWIVTVVICDPGKPAVMVLAGWAAAGPAGPAPPAPAG